MTESTVRGVNLGGWLVLEKWITPSLFAGYDAEDEWTLCQAADEALLKKLRKHYANFITKQDFEWLAARGIGAVRIPVGYWIFGEAKPYLGSIEYLDNAFEWAEDTGVKILLDIHAAPGSQNGKRHSGKAGAVTWHTNEQNIQRTLTFVTQLADRYGSSASLLGIELLNEPGRNIPKPLLEKYYKNAYKVIRRICGKRVWAVFSDGFEPEKWRKALQGPWYRNVYVDTHEYQLFTEADKTLGVRGHIYETTIDVARDHEIMRRYHQVIIGEWCAALDARSLIGLEKAGQYAALRAYAKAQLEVYDQAAAWFYWTYRIEGGGVWSFRDAYKMGILDDASLGTVS